MANSFRVNISLPGNQFPAATSNNRRKTAQELSKFFAGLAAGTHKGASLDYVNAAVASAAAAGTLTIESGTGSVGGSINGVSVTVTWGTSDTATATALAAAINASANALVNKHVRASAVAGVVTLTAKSKGYSGNAVTLAASGTGVTASGARLTGGTGPEGIATSFSF